MASIEQPAPPLSPAISLVSFNFRIPVIVPIFAVALILRLLLASLPGFDVDLGTFRGWSDRLATNDPWNFYQPNEFTDYAPGYMYVLWLIGELNKVLHFNQDQWEYILKIPAIIADLASAYLVYRMLDKESPVRQLTATAIYAFFPPALLVGAFWGQVDSILAFFLLYTVYFLSKDRPVAAAVAYTIGFLVKPQSIAALPFLAFWILRNYAPRLKGVSGITLGEKVIVGVVPLFIISTFARWFEYDVPLGRSNTGWSGEFVFLTIIAAAIALAMLAQIAAARFIRLESPISQKHLMWASVQLVAAGCVITAVTLRLMLGESTAGINADGAYGLLIALVLAATLLAGALLFFLAELQGREPELPKTWIMCALIPLGILIVLITPFFEYKPWDFIDVLQQSASTCSYRVNSFWAYNFWNTGGLFKMGFKPDETTACSGSQVFATTFLGIRTQIWGWVLFGSAIVSIIALLWNKRSTGYLALGVGLSMMAFYLFLTRMHERYVFGAFLPLLVACALIHSRILWALFVATATVHFLNLYHVFGYYYLFNAEHNSRYPDIVLYPDLYHWLEREHNIPILSKFSFIGAPEALQIFSVLFVTAFVGFLVYLGYLNLQRRPPPEAV